MEAVAKVISDTFSASQLPRYLTESGIPTDYVGAFDLADGKLAFVFSVLDALHEGGSAARRVLRQFIGGWLDGRYHVAPSPRVRWHLMAILGQQGWHVHDGRLVIGERTYDSVGKLTPLGMDVRLAALHVDVRAVAERYIESAIEVGIFEAFNSDQQSRQGPVRSDRRWRSPHAHGLLGEEPRPPAGRLVNADRQEHPGRLPLPVRRRRAGHTQPRRS
jgi:hypothetical protein